MLGSQAARRSLYRWGGAGLSGDYDSERRYQMAAAQALQAITYDDLAPTAQQQCEALAAMMAASEPTAFALEAGALYILRAQRCLSGVPWRVADFEARAVTGIALRKVGAIRPKWADGQRNFLPFDAGACTECGAPLYGLDRTKCSAACDQAAVNRRTSALVSLRRAAARAGAGCPHCGRSFNRETSRQRFCSKACQKAAYDVAATARTCIQCGKTFTRYHPPSQPKRKFCSNKCTTTWRWANKGIGPRPARAASAECREVLPGRLEPPEA